MNLQEVMQLLAEYGNERTKNTYTKHGATGNFFGVKVGDLKKILKQTKKDHALALQLFDTQNVDAMYLAGLMADEKKITKTTLEQWAAQANWYMISEFTVPWIAADSPFGWELGLQWIDHQQPNIKATGWGTLSSWIVTNADEELPINTIELLLERAKKEIHTAPNRVRYVMNNFIIAVGGIAPLSSRALAAAEKVGKVSVDMNGTACKVPLAKEYIQKTIDSDRVGHKKKKARC